MLKNNHFKNQVKRDPNERDNLNFTKASLFVFEIFSQKTWLIETRHQ